MAQRHDGLKAISPRALGNRLEAQLDRELRNVNAVFDHGSPNETLGQILARLSSDHPDVRNMRDAEAESERLIAEARRRYGPAVSHRAFWPTFLQVSAPKTGRKRAV